MFLHGLFGRGKNFSNIASGLLPEIDSLLVDLPNHGQSQWVTDISYPHIAGLVAEHLRSGFASEGPIDLIGHSMGGKVAMVLALRFPELVRRLVVLDISPVAKESGRGEFEHLLGALAGVDVTRVERRTDADEALREQIPNRVVRGFLLQNLVRANVGGNSDGGGSFEWQPNLTLLRAELDTIMGFPALEGAQFDAPVLWVRGESSDYVTDEDGSVMREMFPRARRLTLRGAGHWVHSEKPKELTAALRGFLLAE